MPTIKISHNGEVLLTYHSFAIPKVGEWIHYKESKKIDRKAKVVNVYHKIIPTPMGSVCDTVYVEIDKIQ